MKSNLRDLGLSQPKTDYPSRIGQRIECARHRLSRIALSRRRTCDFTLNGLRDALTEVVAGFPVYRTYISAAGVSDEDARYVRLAVASAKWRSPAADTSIFDFISEALLTGVADGQSQAYRDAVLNFAMKFQQFTSPVMAKGLEDTAFYRYNRLVSLNDVGGDLHRFGFTTAEFHSASQDRLRSHPHTMLATSTHDSKRSEDVRARINVLSEMSELWRLRLRDWKRFNRRHKRLVNDEAAPSTNDEYLFYQTLVGAWPFQLSSESSPTEWKTFKERIESYMLKAIREAKQNTSWINRNTEYEEAVSSFVKALLDPSTKNRFLNDFVPFQHRVARIGLWNSLSQTLLKLTSPGVPDIYQGNELWDLSLVDPDNRRAIDYQQRRKLFNSISGRLSAPDTSSIGSLLETPEDGEIKLYLIWRSLCLRQQEPTVFQRGQYLPLAVTGAKANHVIAFARKVEGASVIVIAPRLIAGLLDDADLPPIGPEIWQDTHVLFPCVCRERCQNILTGKDLELIQTEQESDGQTSRHTKIRVSVALAEFPVALCLLN